MKTFVKGKSECCEDKVILDEKPLPEGFREIMYFRCAKCKRLCHLKKEIQKIVFQPQRPVR